MGIRAAWDNRERTIVRLDFEGSWDWNDYRHTIKTAAIMMTEVSHQVDLIFNMNFSGILPSDVQRILNVLPLNSGVIVITGQHALVTAIAAMFRRVYVRLPNRVTVAGSIEEARAILLRELE